MRSGRLIWSLLAVYLVFLGGSAYYFLIFPVRVFHHILITLLLLLWLLLRIRRGQGLPDTPLNLPLMILVVVWFVSAIFSLDSRAAFENLWFPVTHLLMFYVMIDLLQRGQQRLLMETQFLIATLVVMLALAQFISWYFGLGITPDTRIGWASVSGPGAWLPLQPLRLWLGMNVSTWLAGYTAPLVIVTAGWALTARRRDYRTVLWILTVLLALVMILTFSRNGILALGAGAVFFVTVQLLRRYRWREIVSPRILPILMGLVGIVAIVVVSILFIGRTRRDENDSSRLELWRVALATTRDYPLFGVGTGQYGRAFRMYRDPEKAVDRLSTAHNVYLNTAAEIGLIGIAVNSWLAFIFVRTCWRNWKNNPSPHGKTRLEAAFAGLVGFVTASLVDTYTTTSMLLLFFLLLAYCIVDQRNRFSQPIASAPRWTAVLASIVVLGYGVWFIRMDQAQSHHLASLNSEPSDRLEQSHTAIMLDPAMRLYRLQATYLLGMNSDVDEAIAAYENALVIEPTWEAGALNLAALLEQKGDVESALQWVDAARKINGRGSGPLHWARLAEQAGSIPGNEIIASYVQYMSFDTLTLPMSEFWTETDLRRRALAIFMGDQPLDLRYRIAAVHQPDSLESLLPDNPQNAADWWVLGEDALTRRNDPQQARNYFDEAIIRDSGKGDYYVSRARAEIEIDLASAERDLTIAELLGTTYEYPNVVRAQMANNPEDIYQWRVRALPPRVVEQNFEAVLFNRVANFELFPEMRRLGPGTTAMQPWYAIASDYLANNQIEDAVRVYQAILDYAPDEIFAQEALIQLTGAE